MFRVEFLKVSNHPQLGNINLDLSDASEYKKSESPYTSVIIGSNGTGKSFILRTIAEIFRQFQAYSISDEKHFNLPYNIHLRYQYHEDVYEIITRRLETITRSRKKDYVYYKNRPLETEFITKGIFEKTTGFEISHKELKYPNKLLVNSIMNNDRFVFKKAQPNDFYQYLGARSTSSTASTKSSVRKTIGHIFNAFSSDEGFTNNLKDLLNFLEFEESFKVVYKTKINKLFFSRELTEENFRQYFERWWEEDFGYTKRGRENPLWSIPYYNKFFKGDSERTEKLVAFLNEIPSREKIFRHKDRSSSKIIAVDLFDDDMSNEDFKYISELEKLDIINLEGIEIKKSAKNLSIGQISSGEYHLLISLIGIFANISDNSLILIDEPEISLHPNWQMRYITFLKKVFSKFNSCHFILTTHSHFLVSDMEGLSSHLIGLKRNKEDKLKTVDIDANTFGWSAEEVLYEIFNVKSTRNSFIEYELNELVDILNRNDTDRLTELSEILIKLSSLELTQKDPLKILIKKGYDYLKLNDYA